ncbi:PepSY domain-containing protein [Mangrovicoccus sp. HB161399]|uniref:PepSY domain-containing protein n=1 Tax=Mangrovicoccus sp. HB161399 TaxID=2720392 RepID=UPI001C12D4BE|nr:PepSY domain-containing protein [Mangrovicoccus sp. HB161399]
MTRMKAALAALVPCLCLAAGAAAASPTCTAEPQSAWLTEAQMKQKIAEMGYGEIKVFRTSTTGCYEIYGYNKDGVKAEVYFNPVTGEIVEENLN